MHLPNEVIQTIYDFMLIILIGVKNRILLVMKLITQSGAPNMCIWNIYYETRRI